jgi:protocatechuate 3,4-dioxygenase beta subunit
MMNVTKGTLRTLIPMVIAMTLISGCSGQPAVLSPTALAPTSAATQEIPATGATATQGMTATAQPQAPTSTSVDPPAALPTQATVPTDPAGLSCTAPASLTIAMTEGPYFKAGSPERASLLENGVPGKKLTLTGKVLNADCQPVSGALLDFWQADGNGKYDNAGYVLRGHQFSAADGSYTLETVIPGEYPGRTEHIHVKVLAPGGQILTSQLFFPGEAKNQSDRIFDPSLLVKVMNSQGEEMHANFNFIVASGN